MRDGLRDCRPALDLVVFDMDGTLYPDDPRCREAYPAAALEVVARIRGCSDAEAARVFDDCRRSVTRTLGGRPTNTLVLLTCFDEADPRDYARAVSRRVDVEAWLRPDPSATRAVERVADEFPIVLFTTNNEPVTDRTLRAIGMDHLFPPDRRYTMESMLDLPLPHPERVEHLKPGLRGFRHILARHGARPGKTLMVGDSDVSDLRPAERLGLHTYLVDGPAALHRLPVWLGLEDDGEEDRPREPYCW